jgi:hypothetical protein
MRVETVLNMARKEGRVITLCVTLEDLETSAVCRAAQLSEKYIASYVRDTVHATLSEVVVKGLRGLQTDEMHANGSIEIGRPVLL